MRTNLVSKIPIVFLVHMRVYCKGIFTVILLALASIMGIQSITSDLSSLIKEIVLIILGGVGPNTRIELVQLAPQARVLPLN